MSLRKKREPMQYLLGSIAFLAVILLALISLLIIREGWPIFAKFGIGFLFSVEWFPHLQQYGILPMIIGTIYVTLGALILGVPLGIGTAVFLAEIAPPRMAEVVKSAVELLAGIPSTVYGFFGIIVLVPILGELFGGSGFSVLAGALILAIMILPTIISISTDAIRGVPKDFKEGSLALGATHWQTIVRVIIPAAKSGISAAIVLGMGRALGETMAVLMVVGNTTTIPKSIFDPARTLTSNIAVEMGYASGEHLQALFATGIVLFIFIMVLNLFVNTIIRRGGKSV